MHDGSQGNAMTEIALALAMGFFSLLVLTMISMGAGHGSASPAVATLLKAVPAVAGNARSATLGPEDTIVVYHDGRFFDTELEPVEPGAIAAGGRVVLALDPGLSLSEVLRAQARIAAPDLVVSVLDERWLAVLAGMTQRAETGP